MGYPAIRRRRVLLAKAEATPGTAESLTTSEGVFNAFDVKIQQGIQSNKRQGQGAGLSQLPASLSGYMGTCTFSIELTGGASGSEPNITIEAASDCAGVTIHVNDTSANLLGWTFTVTATLNGVPFGTPYAVSFDEEGCDPHCTGWDYPFGATFPNLATSEFYTFAVKMQGDTCVCSTLLDTIVLTPSTSTSDIGFGSISYVGDCTWQVEMTNSGGGDLSGQTVWIDATCDKGLGPEPICGQATLTCEV